MPQKGGGELARDGFLGDLYPEGERTLTGRAFPTEETNSTSPGEAGPAGESGIVGPRGEVPEGSILILSKQVTLSAHFLGHKSQQPGR